MQGTFTLFYIFFTYHIMICFAAMLRHKFVLLLILYVVCVKVFDNRLETVNNIIRGDMQSVPDCSMQ
jgi:hypothetical protein